MRNPGSARVFSFRVRVGAQKYGAPNIFGNTIVPYISHEMQGVSVRDGRECRSME